VERGERRYLKTSVSMNQSARRNSGEISALVMGFDRAVRQAARTATLWMK